jgi:homoserine kinase type II
VAIRTKVTPEELAVFLSDYDEAGGAKGPCELVGVLRGTVNSSYELRFSMGQRLFLRLYEEQDFDGAQVEAQRLSHLAGRGVLTPPPLPRKDGALVAALAGKPAAIFPWVPGDMRCLRAVSTRDGYQVGQALAHLHQAGLDSAREEGRFEPDALSLRLDRIAQATDEGLASLAGPLRERLALWTARRDRRLPRGLIHGDLFRDNVLWTEDGAISALLDFESASDGAFAYDLMVTILAWSYKDAFDAAIARSVALGYVSERSLGEAERRGLLAEGAIAALRFTITRITDEALRALEDNRPPRADKDYRRFQRRLEALEAMGESGLVRMLFG